MSSEESKKFLKVFTAIRILETLRDTEEKLVYFYAMEEDEKRRKKIIKYSNVLAKMGKEISKEALEWVTNNELTEESKKYE